jgi:hypothetical protein
MSIVHSLHIVLLCCTSHDIHHAHPGCAGAMAIKKFSRQELFLIHVGHKFSSIITYTKLKVLYQYSKCFDQIPQSSRGCVPDTRDYNFVCIFKILKITLSIDVQPYNYSHLLTGHNMKKKADYIKNSFVFKQSIVFKIIVQL